MMLRTVRSGRRSTPSIIWCSATWNMPVCVRIRDHRADFLLADAAIRGLAQPEHARDQLGRALQHPDERRADEREQLHRPRERGRDLLRDWSAPSASAPARRSRATGRSRRPRRCRRPSCRGTRATGASSSKPASQSASGTAKRAPLYTPASTPISVMQNCTVDRKRVGSSSSRSAARAPPLPRFASWRSRVGARGKSRELGHREQAVHEDERHQDQEVSRASCAGRAGCHDSSS